MPSAELLEVQGIKSLERKLNRLPRAARNKAVRSAVREAGKPLLDRTKQLAPKETGLMASKIKLRSISGQAAKKSGVKAKRGAIGVVVMTGTREEMGIDPADPYYYPAAVEYGHGNTPAKPFMRRAADEMKGQLGGIAARAMGPAIEREAKKL